jgi:cystathionine gamma-synthase
MSVTPRTKAARAGINRDHAFSAIVPPIYLSTTYGFPRFGQPGAYDYSRAHNPSRDVTADTIAQLEGGIGAVMTASGMAAVSVPLLALMPPGGKLLAPVDAYGGSWRVFDALASKGFFTYELIDFSDTQAALAAIERLQPDVVWLETPSNPLLRICDVALLGEAAHAVKAKVVADNTFNSPAVMRPLELGVDVVVESATKYLAGHSDVVSGVIVTRKPSLLDDLAWWANCIGATGGAFDSYLVLRGVRTLYARCAVAQRNAQAIAEALEANAHVKRVIYPGLVSHPQHELAARQQDGFGAIVTIELDGEDAVRQLVAGLECFTLAESLGGVESLVSHPATMTHAAMPPEAQAAAGITPGMLRLSVGIEDVDDLIADLEAGLARVAEVHN